MKENVTLPLQILADENIPCVQEAFGRFGDVEVRSGDAIGPSEVREADVLLVRSVTPVGPRLLAERSVRFVGSATTGTDHVDRAYLDERGIAFAHAPGANAPSVADYVVTALLVLARQRRACLQGRTIGLIGCGNIGGRLAQRLPALGLKVVKNDPPLADAAAVRDEAHDYHALETVLEVADILTLHVPLKTDGPYPTRHLIGAPELRQLKPSAWLLNTSRGSVVDNEALLSALHDGNVGAAALDVWEEEPTPIPDLVRAVDVATPHVAGYALDGKLRGTKVLHDALCDYLGAEPSWDPASDLPDDLRARRCSPPDPRLPLTDGLYHLARQAFDLEADDRRMRAILHRPTNRQGKYFRHLRSTYPRRRELQRHAVPRSAVPEAYRQAVAAGLTMQML